MPVDTEALPSEVGGVGSLSRLADNAFSRSSAKASLASEVAELTGDHEFHRLRQASRNERDQQLDTASGHAFHHLEERLVALNEAHADHVEKLGIAQSLDRNADELEQQLKARLRAVEKRVVALRRHVKEDVELLSEDGGDEAEPDLRRMSERRRLLLRNDDRNVRERMIAKSMARRHDRLKRRRDEHSSTC